MFDSSYNQGKPLTFRVGVGEVRIFSKNLNVRASVCVYLYMYILLIDKSKVKMIRL